MASLRAVLVCTLVVGLEAAPCPSDGEGEEINGVCRSATADRAVAMLQVNNVRHKVEATSVVATAVVKTSTSAETLEERHHAQFGEHKPKNTTMIETAKAKFGTSTTYCNENSPFPPNCWSGKPSSAEECDPSKGKTVCKCPVSADVECDIDNLNSDPPVTGRCAAKTVYVSNGSTHENSENQFDVTGGNPETFCSDMKRNGEWKERGLVATSSDGDESYEKDSWWHFCRSGYSSSSGTCYRKKRFLGESCWDSYWSGTCQGSDSTYDEYSTACYEGTCKPYAFVQARQPCSCAWIGYNFLVVCSAADDACGGHACVLNAGDGNKYCDYTTGQDWHSLR